MASIVEVTASESADGAKPIGTRGIESLEFLDGNEGPGNYESWTSCRTNPVYCWEALHRAIPLSEKVEEVN